MNDKIQLFIPLTLFFYEADKEYFTIRERLHIHFNHTLLTTNGCKICVFHYHANFRTVFLLRLCDREAIVSRQHMA